MEFSSVEYEGRQPRDFHMTERGAWRRLRSTAISEAAIHRGRYLKRRLPVQREWRSGRFPLVRLGLRRDQMPRNAAELAAARDELLIG